MTGKPLPVNNITYFLQLWKNMQILGDDHQSILITPRQPNIDGDKHIAKKKIGRNPKDQVYKPILRNR